MTTRSCREHFLVAVFAVLVMFLSPLATAASRPGISQDLNGRTHTYYVAADELDWDYAPSGRDEAMGQPFDALRAGYAEPGPHHIGRVNKKAIYRECTDESFTTLKQAGTGTRSW